MKHLTPTHTKAPYTFTQITLHPHTKHPTPSYKASYTLTQSTLHPHTKHPTPSHKAPYMHPHTKHSIEVTVMNCSEAAVPTANETMRTHFLSFPPQKCSSLTTGLPDNTWFTQDPAQVNLSLDKLKPVYTSSVTWFTLARNLVYTRP